MAAPQAADGRTSEGPPARVLAAWESFLTAHALLIEEIDRELRDGVGIPLGWYDVLYNLHEAPDGSLRMHDLADRVLISRSNCTRLVDRLAERGLVRRREDANDRRGVVAEITEDGLDLYTRASRVHLDGVAAHWATFVTDEDAELIDTRCREMVEALRAAR